MSSERDVQLRFLFNPVFHMPEAQGVEAVTLSFLDKKDRNSAQAGLMERLSAALLTNGRGLPSDPLTEQCVCYAVDPAAQQICALNGERLFREVLYLFNLVIALEWRPDRLSYQQIRLAAARASDFLYDVTNGYMAIGQVVIGGPDLMEAADIQILASNRIHPRAWNGALNEAAKFKPIRVGRGLWQKNQERLLTWDTPEGYRALAHEWGHYAYSLADDYLGRATLERAGPQTALWKQLQGREARAREAPLASDLREVDRFWSTQLLDLALPDIALPVESLMASTQISEFAKLPTIFGRIRSYYNRVTDPQPLSGPEELPLGLPYFRELVPRPFGGLELPRASLGLERPEELELPVLDPLARTGYNPDERADQTDFAEPESQSHWIYLLKAPFHDEMPERVIAQGKLGRRDRERGAFRLLGAAAGDQVLLISQVGPRLSAHRAELLAGAEGGPALEPGEWLDVSPPADVARRPFFVDLLPAPVLPVAPPPGSFPQQAEVRVSVTAAVGPDKVGYYASGALRGEPLGWDKAAGRSDPPISIPHLDGHILLRWANGSGGREGMIACSCSQGGGGGQTSAGGILPVTGGSSDGNAMVFFNANTRPLDDLSLGEAVGMRLVTTTLTAAPPTLDLIVAGAPAGTAEARSYVFSVASNEPLVRQGGEPFTRKAALVLYYDNKAARSDGELLVYRWDDGNQRWQPLTTFARPDLPYVAVPLGALDADGELETAPALTRSDWRGPRVERYRIYWTPAAALGGGALPETRPYGEAVADP